MDAAVLKIGLPVALAIIMFGMGLGLTIADFTRVFARPKAFLTGAFLQIIMLPAVAIGILYMFPMSAPLAVGLMILAACPGGVTSNLLTYIARGDVALSVSLTAMISVAGFITVPLITVWALGNFMQEGAPELPIAKTMIGILVITTVPVIFGMIINKLAPAFARAADKVFGPLSLLIFFAVLAGALYTERENVLSYIAQSGFQVILLNLATMIIAAGVGDMLALGRRQRSAITLECGLQNSTLGLVIAVTILARTDIAIPVAIYGLLMFFSGFSYAWWARRKTNLEHSDG